MRLLAVFQNDGGLRLTPCIDRFQAARTHEIISEFEMLGVRLFLAKDNIASNQITEAQMSILFAAVQAEVARSYAAKKRPASRATGQHPRCPDDRY
jgi:hypothetical protein